MVRKGDDRRKHPRVEARLAMQLAEDAMGTHLVTTESLNMSRGGVYCESPEFLAPLSKVALTVVLPGFGVERGRSRMLRCDGVVVRCEPLPPIRSRRRWQLACCFTGLDADQRALLDDFVAWRALRGRRPAAARQAAARRGSTTKRGATSRSTTRTRSARTTGASARGSRTTRGSSKPRSRS